MDPLVKTPKTSLPKVELKEISLEGLYRSPQNGSLRKCSMRELTKIHEHNPDLCKSECNKKCNILQPSYSLRYQQPYTEIWWGINPSFNENPPPMSKQWDTRDSTTA